MSIEMEIVPNVAKAGGLQNYYSFRMLRCKPARV
jgi:hypothetical protein